MKVVSILINKSQISATDRLKSTSTTGLIVGILGTIIGALVLIVGIYLISIVYGKGSSPLGIFVLYGLVLSMLAVLPLLLGLTTLVPSIISKIALKNLNLKLLKIVKIISIVQIIIIVLAFIVSTIYSIINGDGLGKSITVATMGLFEIGIPLSIFPIIYITNINSVLKEVSKNNE